MPSARRILIAALSAAAVHATPGACDEGDAFNFIAGSSLLRDSNVFRLPDGVTVGGARADTQRNSFVGGTFDWTYGRQRLKGDLTLSHVRYARFDFLDYNGAGAQATWLWQLGHRWKGELAAERRKVLTDFADLQFGPAQAPQGNLTTTERYRAGANYWFHPDWSLLGTLTRTRATNSAAFRRANDFTGDSGELGVSYRRASGNELGLRYRITNGRFPNRAVVAASVVDNSYRQDDVEANALWIASGHSRVTARGGWTRRSHDELPQRDFRGLTGRLTYDWLLDGKSALAVTLRREIANSDFANAAFADVRGFSIAPTWSPTARTSLVGRYEYRAVDYRGDPGIVLANAPQRQDRTEILGLTGSYAPWRFLEISLTVQTERRRSNDAQLSYRDNASYLSAQFSF